jgi:endothelin-converting enzyme/putative endopeptidase
MMFSSRALKRRYRGKPGGKPVQTRFLPFEFHALGSRFSAGLSTVGNVAFLVLLTCGAAFAQSQSGVDLSAIDSSVSPCADFYQYACGGWLKNNPIPPDQSSWGRFNVLNDNNQAILRKILEDAGDSKIGLFYSSCMDETEIDKLGAQPLQPELDHISAIKNKQELMEEVARLHERGVDVLFNFSSSADLNDASVEIANIDQGGIGLPEKDYYFRSDAKSEEIRKKYVDHVAKMFELIGVSHDEAAKKAAIVMSIETALAKVSLDITARRDPKSLLHEMPKAELLKMSPDFNFAQYFAAVHAPAFSKLNVAVPSFVTGMNSAIAARSMNEWRDYLTWHWVSDSAHLLSKPFVEENFDFYSRTLSGTPQMRPRWKRCVSATDSELGEALGQKFVEKTFGEQGKERTLAMVHEIEDAMEKDIESIKWMSPETKQKALIKLKKVTNKIGYPDKWRDYSSVNIVAGDYFGNWYRATEFEAKRQWDKIGKPVDRGEWGMTPPTVNAYYDPSENNINFPAGILQPPFYSNQSSDAVNYGAVGAVIGHELTHGFDDEGRQFDGDGNLKDWWTKTDEQQFNTLADCLVNEYGGFSPIPGVELNGKLTLGENTADNGGIHLALAALIVDLKKKGVSLTEKTDGFTPEQQFFLGFGQIWCQNQRPEQARMLAQVDPHSPSRFRVDGVVSNMPEFSTAFACKPGDKMYAVKGCRVW